MPLDNTTKPKMRIARVKIAPLTEEEIAKAKAEGPKAIKPEIVRVSRPKLETAQLHIIGVTAYVQHAFSEKQRKIMEEKQRAGQQGKAKKVREPKDFQAAYEAARHISTKGWYGIPAPAFRNAMISACKMCGIVMTRAKLSIFVVADGVEANGDPLVKITHGKPRISEKPVRNESGVADIRWRPLFDPGWRATVTLRWDEDQFSSTDIANLMLRAGMQVGIGEGRPDSPNSNGIGWGQFELFE